MPNWQHEALVVNSSSSLGGEQKFVSPPPEGRRGRGREAPLESPGREGGGAKRPPTSEGGRREGGRGFSF